MPKKRRYASYSFEDTQRAIQQQQRQLGIRVLPGSASKNGRRIRVHSREHQGEMWAVILARSSEWYRYNLNTYASGIEAALVGTHDSCLSVPVLAMDSLTWYTPFTTRYDRSLQPPAGVDLRTQPDFFDRFRRSRYGHQVLLGALIVGRRDAAERLMTFPERTRFQIEAEVKRLRHRRPGRPLKLWEDDEEPR